jgi:membrane protease YdiL (CAAX protease family)
MITSENSSIFPKFPTLNFGCSIQEVCDLPHQVVSKTAAVAIAFFLWTIEMQLATPICAGIALSAAVVTVISYKILEHKDKAVSSWFSINSQDIEVYKKHALNLAIIQISSIALEHLVGITFELQMPLSYVIVYACIWAPFVEEVICRGFFQEQIKNSLDLLDRKVIHIDERSKKEIALIGQAILFGALHVQYFVLQQIFCACIGYALGSLKNESEGSLLLCMAGDALANSIALVDIVLS